MSTESEHLRVVHASRRRICSYNGKGDLCVPLPQLSKISSPVFKVLESTLLDRRTLILISTKNEKWKLRFYSKMEHELTMLVFEMVLLHHGADRGL